ncbi:hypothetical protein PG984_005644 [Apiospora sp. TS-2023a]
MSGLTDNLTNGTQPGAAHARSKHGGMAQSIHKGQSASASGNRIHQVTGSFTSGSGPFKHNYQSGNSIASGSSRRTVNQNYQSNNTFTNGSTRGTANRNYKGASSSTSGPVPGTAQGNSKGSRGRRGRDNHGYRSNHGYNNNQKHGSNQTHGNSHSAYTARGAPIGTANNTDYGRLVPYDGPTNSAVSGSGNAHDNVPAKGHTVNPSDDLSVKDNCMSQRFLSQVQLTHKIEPLGAFYELERDFRDELWDDMKLKIPKFEGYESWAIPFPADLNPDFMKIALGNKSYSYLDDRFIRLIFRYHKDADGKIIGYDLLLSPSNPSIELDGLQFRAALMDAWYKLNKWLVKLIAGEKVPLYLFLHGDLEREVKEKLERTL